MDFSVHEQRRLAQIEQELSADRRLVSLMAILGSTRTRNWRRLQYVGCRVRRPRRQATGSWLTGLALVGGLFLTVAVPILLITSLIVGLASVAVVAACVLPLPPVLLVFAIRRSRRSRGGIRPVRES
jgi:hypothetical protein